jgi:hypothetical protein
MKILDETEKNLVDNMNRHNAAAKQYVEATGRPDPFKREFSYAPRPPAFGTVRNGYLYVNKDPNSDPRDKSNWKPVPKAKAAK